MHTQVASRLVVTSSAKQYTQAVSMDGGNAIYVDVTAFTVTGGTVRITVQEGNDLDNWTTLTGTGSTLDLTAAGYGTLTRTAIAAQYVRLQIEQVTSGTGVLAAGINVSNL